MIGEFLSLHPEIGVGLFCAPIIVLCIWICVKCDKATMKILKKRAREEIEQEQRENEAFRASIKRDKPTYEEWLAQREKEKKD